MVLPKINFDNHPVNLRKQNFQVQNITTSKLDRDDEDSQFPPTHASTLEDCYPSNIRKQNLQVQKITIYKPNTDDQGRQLPPTNPTTL